VNWIKILRLILELFCKDSDINRTHKLPHFLILSVCIIILRTGDADLRFYITTVQDG